MTGSSLSFATQKISSLKGIRGKDKYLSVIRLE